MEKLFANTEEKKNLFFSLHGNTWPNGSICVGGKKTVCVNLNVRLLPQIPEYMANKSVSIFVNGILEIPYFWPANRYMFLFIFL